jgi:hypothetical protein
LEARAVSLDEVGERRGTVSHLRNPESFLPQELGRGFAQRGVVFDIQNVGTST